MAEPRIVLYDIETTHNLAAIFRLYGDDFIGPDNIVQERYIVSAAWKILGEDKVHAVSTLDNPKLFKKDPFSDKHVCEVLHEVLSGADVIIAHNGDKYDIKFAETRMLINGLEPLPPITSIDTLKVAKKRFLFNSNKLDYIGKVLGVGRKVATTPGLWLEVLRGNKSAIKEMVTYNKQDVLLLERVFLKLRPYVAEHISRELFGGVGCPRCGSKKVQKRGVHRAITRVYQRYCCGECGGWFRELRADKTVATKRVL